MFLSFDTSRIMRIYKEIRILLDLIGKLGPERTAKDPVVAVPSRETDLGPGRKV